MFVSDAAKRCSETIQTHVLAGNWGKWAAIRLSDGGSDNIPYDSKADAVRHQLHEMLCAYIKMPIGGMPPADAERFLQLNRKLYDAGMRLSDPDRQVISPLKTEDLRYALNQLRTLR